MFMSQPRAIEGKRKKFRDINDMEEELGDTANMMFDPRVIRGVTCVRPDDELAATLPMATQQLQTAVPIRRPTKAHLIRAGKIRPEQPSVREIHENIVVPKKRVEVPLHLYLIEQAEPVYTTEENTQTDEFLAEEPTPIFRPRKTGVDVETQVDSEEVFDYDKDVMPILEVVISKSMEQSIMEVRQEEELRWISFKKVRAMSQFHVTINTTTIYLSPFVYVFVCLSIHLYLCTHPSCPFSGHVLGEGPCA
jgi:hypothetical protein